MRSEGRQESPPESQGTPEAVMAGEEQLKQALETLRRQVDQHVQGFSEGVEEAVTAPLRQAFETAHSAHGRLLEEAGLLETSVEGGTPEASTADWRGLRAYREGVRQQVLEPLRDALAAVDVGDTLALRWEGFQNGLPGIVRDLPAQIVRLEPADLYDARAGDGFWIRGRKVTVRTGRGIQRLLMGAGRALVGILGRPTGTPHLPTQIVPLADLARSCLLGRCPLALEPFSEALQQHFALPLSNLASGVADWAREWHPAEAARHTPEGHLSQEALTRLEATLVAIRPKSSGAADGGAETTGPAAPLPTGTEAGAPDTDEDGGPGPDSGKPPNPDPAEAAGTLHSILARGAALESPEKPLGRIRDAMEGEWEHLLEQVRVAGSFQRDGRSQEFEDRFKRLDARLHARTALWDEWHKANLERVTLVLALMRLREGWDRAQDQLLESMVEKTLLPILEPWTNTRAVLLEMEREAEDLLSGTALEREPAEAVFVVETLMDRAQGLMKEEFLDPTEASESQGNPDVQADAVVGMLSEALRATPGLLTLSSPQPDPDRVEPGVEVRNVPLRENLLKVVDVVRLEALRQAPVPVMEILAGARSGYQDIPEIASFNLSSARDELVSPSEDTPPDQALRNTRDLVTDGLERTAGAIQGLLEEMPNAWETFLHQTHAFFDESFSELHRRTLVEGFVQEQILDFRSRVESQLRNTGESLRILGKKLSGGSRKLFRRLRIRILRMARLGRYAVGMAQTSEGEAERALEILRASPQLLESLPLVYRRLFSFQPLSDPALLMGREDSLDWINRRFQAWEEGTGVPSVLLGGLGAGQTSLLNVAEQTLLKDVRVFRLALGFRPESQEALAAWLAKELELPEQSASSLEAVGDELLSQGDRAPRRVIVVEHLEQLLLRVPGGTGLVEEFLALQARTSGSVFWLSGITTAAWQYLTKTEPAMATMVSVQPLSLPSREALEQLILTRHQRSGLTLEFLEPPGLNPLTRRKLRKARGEKGRQEVLRNEFFDRLHRMSEGSVAMAILFWLHALDFGQADGKVRVRPPRPVRFSFLEELDLTAEFALMALMEHGTLTLDEYARIFQASREEAWQIFEVLRTRMLLEPMNRETSLPRTVKSIEEEGRYRVPPILGQVVSQRLRNRNILH